MLDREVASRSVIDALEARRYGGAAPDLTQHEQAKLDRLQWERYADPDQMRLRAMLSMALDEFPKSDRNVRPTRLGNAIRAREEFVLRTHDGYLETYVLERFDELPFSIRTQHDQFRSRLDLYCSLVAVTGLGAVVSGAVLLSGEHWGAAAVTALVCVLASWLSYRAAVVSGRSYGRVLVSIAQRAPAS